MKQPEAIILMGPSGCGKSSVGRALSLRTGDVFIEGDDHHPALNIQKMASGIALQDCDRAAWLDALISDIDGNNADTATTCRVIVACSALTPYVRQRLLNDSKCDIRFILLQLKIDALELRLDSREGHFMNPTLLKSQLAALTIPQDADIVDADRSIDAIVDDILECLAA